VWFDGISSRIFFKNYYFLVFGESYPTKRSYTKCTIVGIVAVLSQAAVLITIALCQPNSDDFRDRALKLVPELSRLFRDKPMRLFGIIAFTSPEFKACVSFISISIIYRIIVILKAIVGKFIYLLKFPNNPLRKCPKKHVMVFRATMVHIVLLSVFILFPFFLLLVSMLKNFSYTNELAMVFYIFSTTHLFFEFLAIMILIK
jgi:hypothetical protein